MKVIIKEYNPDKKHFCVKTEGDAEFAKVKIELNTRGEWGFDPGWRSDFLLSAEELRAIADKLDELNNIKRRK